ncbi:FIG00496272: hypothetical protein [hydrothermal vent metagenome]|uniref:Aminoglycoside phosphotransferase domain-containing protein n=1 Tax=hydrothermal vent metagenome TaxID=652676 RepID=A0A3B0ZBF7_9ZZZZ
MTEKIANKLITALLDKSAYDHSTYKITLLETHISWVILTGEFAYKIKKPVNLGFLDFSTVEKRHFYCNEELRLNSRLAPQLYLAVVTINGSKQKPYINGDGKVIEYAVKMRQFSQQTQFDRLLENNKLTEMQIDSLASTVAKFHSEAEIADKQSEYGNSETILTPAIENFTQIKKQHDFICDIDQLKQLEDWSYNYYYSHKNTFFHRKNNNYIRECHGDMHLRNIAYWQDEIVIFDCLEFDDKLRWIDVISEIAFSVMDLDERNKQHLAWRFLNAYLEYTGDYSAITVFRFYLVYRAMVRAKINCIQSQQIHADSLLQHKLIQNYNNYINLALNYTKTKQTKLIITHGLSGTGKTTLSQKVLEKKSLIRLRADIERKRLFGLDALSFSNSNLNSNLYSKVATDKTYQQLFKFAKPILQNGWSVIIDASFLDVKYRQQALLLAEQNNAQFIILDCHASKAKLQQRITTRLASKIDASEACHTVLEQQIKDYQPITTKEHKYTIQINTEHPLKDIQFLI